MNPQILPRRDLRESAFRKYEPYIAKALAHEQTIIDPNELRLSATTFAARIRDAIRAKRLFKYKSLSVPDGVDLTVLDVYELTDGKVIIRNTGMTRITTEVPIEGQITEATITDLMQKVASHEVTGIQELHVQSKEELNRVLAIAETQKDSGCIVTAKGLVVSFYIFD